MHTFHQPFSTDDCAPTIHYNSDLSGAAHVMTPAARHGVLYVPARDLLEFGLAMTRVVPSPVHVRGAAAEVAPSTFLAAGGSHFLVEDSGRTVRIVPGPVDDAREADAVLAMQVSIADLVAFAGRHAASVIISHVEQLPPMKALELARTLGLIVRPGPSA